MIRKRCGLDTNILLYLADDKSPFHMAAIEAVANLLSAGKEVVLARQVLFEFWVAATRPVDANGMGWAVARTGSTIRNLADKFPIIPEPPQVLDIWLDLVIRHDMKGKRIHDAHLIASLIAGGWTNS